MGKKYIITVTGETYDGLFIHIVDDTTKKFTAVTSWRMFEECIQKLRNDAKKDGFKDIEVEMNFA